MRSRLATCVLALGLAACPPPGELSFITAALPAGNVDSAYLVPLETAGGTSPLHFELADGALHAGLELEADSGQLRGTPIEPGLLTFEVQASDARGARARQAFSLRVFPNPPPRIITAALPSPVLGRPYSLGLQAVDGRPPYWWSLGPGELPPGLRLDPPGALDGSATAVGGWEVDLVAEDRNGQQARATFSIAVYTEVTLSPDSLPDAYTDAPYAADFTGQGGLPPYRYELVGGALPAGLALDAEGHLAGTPGAAGSAAFAVSVRDESGQAPSVRYTLDAYDPPAIITSALPDASAGAPYLSAIQAAGGKAPLVFSLASGALPSGLSLQQDGILSGTPADPGASSFEAQVSDANGRTHRRAFTLDVL